MNISINRTQHIPARYAPKGITKKDREKQLKSLRKSRKLYKEGQYYTRPKIASFHHKKSRHLEHAYKMYGVNNMKPTRKLANATKCSVKTLKKIINKGEGAYFSSGSRPSQTAQSWGYARLASALTGGNSSIVDFHLLNEGCQTDSLALQLAKQTCRKQNKCQKYISST
jgi:hypothetical protein